MTALIGAGARPDVRLPETFADFWSHADKDLLWAFVVFLGDRPGDRRLDFLLALDDYSNTSSTVIRRALAGAIFSEFVAVEARRPMGVTDADARDIADVIDDEEGPDGPFTIARRHVAELVQADYELFLGAT